MRKRAGSQVEESVMKPNIARYFFSLIFSLFTFVSVSAIQAEGNGVRF
ncbi:MAG: hypothetical protein U1E01_20030 [Methylicorpusculum sp.]|nr:hypothetical protein [Methylicorpusculum sp.]